MIGRTQIFYRAKTMIGQAKIEGGEVGEEARRAAVGETTSRATKTDTRKRGRGGAYCGEGVRPGGEAALAEGGTLLAECVGGDARWGERQVAARGDVGAREWEGGGALSTWPPRRQPSDATCRRPMGTGGWGASLEIGRVRTGGSQSGAREREIERGQRQCTGQGQGPVMSCRPSRCRQKLGLGGTR
jgi:hypothetical protein